MPIKVGELYQSLELDDSDFQKGMAEAESSSGGLANILKTGVVGATATAGAALAGMAVKGTQSMKELDDATNDFAVATGATEEEMESFQNTVQDLHKVNTDSYEELGDAVTAMHQRHGDAVEGMEQDFLDYGKVTGQDTADAVEQLHGVQQAWGQDLDDQTEVMDTFTAVAQDTGIGVEDLQKNMAELAPVAEAIGMDFDETTAMLGQFEKMGVDSATATRGLRNAMTRLEDPTDDQAEALEGLGITLRDADGNMTSTEDRLEQLMGKLNEGELSSEEMSDALDILGRRAGTDMVRALEDGEMGMEEMMETIQDSEGTVEDASETFDKSLGERWTLIQRQYLYPFMEVIGEQLIGAIESTLDFLEEWGPKVAEVFETVTGVVQNIFADDGEISGFLDEFADKFEGIAEAVTDIVVALVDIFEDFWDIFGDDIVSMIKTNLDTIRSVVENVFGIIEGVLETVAGLLTGDFERAVNGLSQIWENSLDTVETIVTNTRDNLVTIFGDLPETVLGIFEDMWDNIVGFVSDLPGRMIDFGKDMVQGLADGIVNNENIVRDTLKDLAGDGVIGTVAETLGIFSPSREMMAIGEYVNEGLAQGIRDAQELPENAVRETSQVVLGETENFAEEVKKEYSSLWQSVKEYTDEIKSTVIDKAHEITMTISENIVDGLKSIISDVISESEELQTVVDWLGEMYEQFISELLEAGRPLVEFIMENLLPIFEELFGFLADNIMPIFENLFGIIEEHVMPVFQSLFELLTDIILPIFERLFEAILPVIEIILDGVMPIIDTVIEVFGSLLEAIYPVIETIIQLLKPALDILFSVITPVIELIGDVLNPALELFGNAIKTVANAMIGIIRGVISALNVIPGVSISKPDYIGDNEGEESETEVPEDRETLVDGIEGPKGFAQSQTSREGQESNPFLEMLEKMHEEFKYFSEKLFEKFTEFSKMLFDNMELAQDFLGDLLIDISRDIKLQTEEITKSLTDNAIMLKEQLVQNEKRLVEIKERINDIEVNVNVSGGSREMARGARI